MEADYYILQGSLKSYTDGSRFPSNVEKPGVEGLNRYTFWYSDARKQIINSLSTKI